ncbi:MAG: VOC family protein [Sciscionella sp.]
MVEDVDAHHAHAVGAGAEIVHPPTDQPYGFREYSARDPEGGPCRGECRSRDGALLLQYEGASVLCHHGVHAEHT